MTDHEQTIREAMGNSLIDLKQMPDGSYIGVVDFLFTRALMIGITPISYDRRFCYHKDGSAEIAFKYWNGTGDPVGNWIKEKPSGRERVQW